MTYTSAPHFPLRRTRGRLAGAAMMLTLPIPLAACGIGNDAAADDGDGAASTTAPTTLSAPAGDRGDPTCRPGTLAGRDFVLCTAADADTDDPQGLIVALHGRGSSAEEIRAVTELHEDAAGAGLAVVYPEALDAGWGDDTFPSPERPTGDEDLTFLDELIAEVRAEPDVDDGPVGMVGFSNGGSMALRYGAQRPDQVRAIVSVAGQQPLDPAVRPTGEVPLLQIYGTDDPIRGYETGIPEPDERRPGDSTPTMSTPDTVAAFVDAARGNPRADDPEPSDPNPDDSTTLETTTWHRGHRTVAALVTVVGGGHTWPSPHADMEMPVDFGVISEDVDASAEAVGFVADPGSWELDS